ncbi:NlpC/P60 family protein [Nocardiopsis exhalans]|uniref:NlpC/P60 family protein n=1 Tax=Nocardiopsis exhalans TaxID=163604 RepID=A0ABY5DCN6_9ACTN|nr:NlpC/P60 family protein [Nocardiopsis exhalans]USY21114.1 NlpC/P60 family protein [Nocardiopsis exhalans]
MPLSTDEIRRWDEALRQATGSAQQLAGALEGIKQSAGSVTEGLSSVTAANQELASGLKTVQDSASQTGAEISTIGTQHTELTTLFTENGKKQQESLEQIAENTKKTQKSLAEESAKSVGTITKEFVALGALFGADGTGPFAQLATQFSTAAISVATLGEEFKKLQKADAHTQALQATGKNASQMGKSTRRAGESTGMLTGALALGAAAFGPWGLAAAGVIAVGGMVIQHFQKAAAEAEEFKEALRFEGGMGENSISHLAERMRTDDIPSLLNEAGVSTQTFTQAVAGQTEATNKLNQMQEENSDRLMEVEELLHTSTDLTWEQREALLAEADTLVEKGAALGQLSQRQSEYSEDIREGTAEGREYHELFDNLTEATSDNAAATGDMTTEQQRLTDEFNESKKAADDLRNSLDQLTGGTVDAMRAEANYHDSLRSATAAIHDNRGETDLSTKSGNDLLKEMEGLRSSTIDYMVSQREQGRTTSDLVKEYEDQRDELIELMGQYHDTEEEAADYVDTIMGTPEEIETRIRATGTGSWDVSTPSDNISLMATGGAVIGPGTGTSDDIPALLSNGEHVLTAKEVQQAGGQAGVYRLRSAIRQGYVGFASGGAVGDHDPQRFARGGAVRSQAAHAISEHTEDTRIGIQNLHQSVIAGIGNYFGSLFKRLFNSGGPVVAAARTQLGVPYSWGGGGISGPSLGFGRGANTRGFDCSSLMQYAWYQGAGVRIPRVTYDQINTGRAISRGSEAPGDLVFPHRGHVAMVTKPGQLIHAPYTGASVSHRAMYPSPLAIRRPSRLFDSGGIWGSGTVGVNESGHPERVLSPRQTRAFEHLVDGVLSGHRVPVSPGAHATADRPLVGTVNVNHVPGYSTPRDVVRALDHARRTARLARPR